MRARDGHHLSRASEREHTSCKNVGHNELAWPQCKNQRGVTAVQAEPVNDPIPGAFRVPRVGREAVQVCGSQARRLCGGVPLSAGTWEQEHIGDRV